VVTRLCAAILSCALAPLARAASLQESYADAAGRIVGAETVDGRAYEILRHLTDRVGPRLTGSAGAEAAVAWTAARLEAFGLDVRTEPVMVPHWIRGDETASLVAPTAQKIVVTALGGSEPTPDGGITAEVVEVDSFEALEALGADRVRGRIVLYNKAMAKVADYGVVAPMRHRGASEAARLGAVAMLIRSLGTYSLRLPHTGAMDYDPALPKIPAAAITAEDAELIHRLLASGDNVRVKLRLTCRTLPDVPSANVVADLKGREKPEEVVVIGAHLDSWDLGTGAIDDGAGVAMVMESLRLLKELGLTPRRTIRGVLFMNEENGLRGGKTYAEAHKSELDKHVAALESDSGAARPEGFTASTGPGGLETLAEIARLLEGIGADRIQEGGGGADIGPLRSAAVPLLSLDLDTTHYFDWHHTSADTLDKVDPHELAQGAAAMAVMAYVLADMPGTLPRLSASDAARP
jgi:hypothetical protein